MANEYKLSYTAEEINNKLGLVERHVHSYNDLTDKTHYSIEFEDITIYFNEVQSNEYIDITSFTGTNRQGEPVYAYKFSDTVLTKEILENANITHYSTYDDDYSCQYNEVNLFDIGLGEDINVLACQHYVNPSEPAFYIVIISCGIQGNIGGIEIPSIGTYIARIRWTMDNIYSISCPEVVKTLDEKYIPATIARKSDLVSGSGQAIIDVTELPTEGVSEGAFYRLMSAQFVYNKNIYSNWICKCVDSLPANPEPVSKDFENIYTYYNISDGLVYGYVDSLVSSAAGGVPVGWYTLEQLAPAFDLTWDGAITHIDDDPEDDTWRVLLKYEFYVYKDGWMNVPFGYENPPAFDIQWDGEIGDKFSLDLSLLGNTGFYLVKVSDDVFTEQELIGTTYTQTNGCEIVIDESYIDTGIYPGAITIDGGALAIVHDSDTLNSALGTPAGYVTNGAYFVLYDDGSEYWYTDRLVAPTKVTKIDSKFIDVDTSALDNLATVARTGYYSDLLGRPTVYEDVVRHGVSQSLSSSQKSRARTNIDVYSKSEVDTKIAEAIGTAIGSGY